MSDPCADTDAIFTAAIEIQSPQEREAYLRQACGDDPSRLQRLQRLLAAHFRAGEFLEIPAPGLPADLPNEAAGTEVGATIGPYQLIERIGEGGMGTVFRARQTRPVRREVALKVIKLGMDTRQVIVRFDAERQALAMMDHPNIAKVFDAGSTDTGRPYFVMELVRGIPVTWFCDENRLTIEDRLKLFAQIGRAVQHAHQKGVIHRDIKPSNVLVSVQDEKPLVKVIDFGIAKATQARLTEKTIFTEHHQLIGTPEYMSPEQAAGEADIDTRSDVYSLGVLLYELLVGAPPFDGRELRSKAYAEMQRVIREVDPPTPSTRLSTLEALPLIAAQRGVEPRRLSATIRGELDWIVMKCLAKDRARRYDSAGAVVEDVASFLAHKPVRAGPPSRAYRLRKFVRRNRAAVAAAGLILLLLVGGITGTTLGLIEARKQRDEAERQRAEAEEQTAMALAVSRFQSRMLSSADPARLLGDKVTVLQAVTAAVHELDAGALSHQPLVEANVRETIGNTLGALGRYDVAAPNFQKALALRRRTLSSDHVGIAHSLRGLALNLQNQGKLREAEPLFRESLAIYRRALPASDAAIPRAIAHVAEVLKMQGRFADAEPLAREAIELQRTVHATPDEDTAGMMTNLGLILRAQRKFDEAEPLLREALAIRRRTLPANHPDLAKAVGNLATLVTDQKKFDEAETLVREVLRIQQATLPEHHPDKARTLTNLAWVMMDRDKPADAEPLFRESTAMFERTLGSRHWLVGNGRRGLGVALTQLKRYDQAEAELLAAERVLASAEEASLDRHARCVRALVALYRAWDQAEPGRGHALRAERWRSKLSPTQPATQSGTRPSAAP